MKYTDIIYIITIIGLLAILSTTNKELERNYEKGYNTRQAEIMDAIKEADGWCEDDIKSGHRTSGYMVDSKITLIDFTTEENRFNERISFKCQRDYENQGDGEGLHVPYPKSSWNVDAIWIGNSRCECIDFDLN